MGTNFYLMTKDSNKVLKKNFMIEMEKSND